MKYIKNGLFAIIVTLSVVVVVQVSLDIFGGNATQLVPAPIRSFLSSTFHPTLNGSNDFLNKSKFQKSSSKIEVGTVSPNEKGVINHSSVQTPYKKMTVKTQQKEIWENQDKSGGFLGDKPRTSIKWSLKNKD